MLQLQLRGLLTRSPRKCRQFRAGNDVVRWPDLQMIHQPQMHPPHGRAFFVDHPRKTRFDEFRQIGAPAISNPVKIGKCIITRQNKACLVATIYNRMIYLKT